MLSEYRPPKQGFLIMIPLTIDSNVLYERAALTCFSRSACVLLSMQRRCAVWAAETSLCPFYLGSGRLHSSPQSVKQPSASERKSKVTWSWCLFFKRKQKAGMLHKPTVQFGTAYCTSRLGYFVMTPKDTYHYYHESKRQELDVKVQINVIQLN